MTEAQRKGLEARFPWVNRAYYYGGRDDAAVLDVSMDEVSFDRLCDLAKELGTKSINFGTNSGYYGEPDEHYINITGITKWP